MISKLPTYDTYNMKMLPTYVTTLITVTPSVTPNVGQQSSTMLQCLWFFMFNLLSESRSAPATPYGGPLLSLK
jgi:hypothetical protein